MKNEGFIRANLLSIRLLVDEALNMLADGDSAQELDYSAPKEFQPVSEQDQWRLGRIRELLTKGFGPEELKRFCSDEPEFRPVYHRLGDDTGKGHVVTLLLEHAKRQDKMGVLLGWCKIQNPRAYQKLSPFGTSDE